MIHRGRHFITGEPVIQAPDRAGRPDTYAQLRNEMAPAPPYDPACPFCPGNEHETPPEIVRIGDPWRVRVFPNKYPFAPHHEVVVESPAHDAAFPAIEWARDVVSTLVQRQGELSSRPGVRHVTIFKNHGPMAGASLRHVHSQITGLDFMPPRVVRELDAFQTHPCPLCTRPAHVVGETETFLSIAPETTPFASQVLIAPKRHMPAPVELSSREVTDLANLLQLATAAAERVSGSHNWLFLSFPPTSAGHFYVEVFPRTSPVAGFELATGTYIDQGRIRG